MNSHLVDHFLVPKSIEEIHPAGAQVEESNKGGLGMLFGIDQATEIDEQLSAHAFLEKSDQSKFRSAMKGLIT